MKPMRIFGVLLIFGLLSQPLSVEAKRRRTSKVKRRFYATRDTRHATRNTQYAIRIASRSLPRAAVKKFQLPIPPLEKVSAKAALLMDAKTGQVIFERNGDAQMFPASCTKILTALLALERGKLSDKVKVSARASQTEPSSVYLQPGESLTLKQLLYALMLKSANDAAVAIAEHVGGSVEKFAKLMNERARKIGCTRTHFVTPNGLHDKAHVSSAHDLALITREALKNRQFRAIITTPVAEMPWTGKPWKRVVYNKNKLLSLFPGADGVKTGYTHPAGRCLVASATRNGWQLIAVVLRCDNVWQDAAGVLAHGFHRFQPVPLVQKGEAVSGAKITNGVAQTCRAVTANDFAAACPKNQRLNVERRATWRTLRAPVKKGQRVGTLTVSVNGREVGKVPLLAAQAVPLSLTAMTMPWFALGGWGTLAALMGFWGYGTATKIARARRRRVPPRRRTAH